MKIRIRNSAIVNPRKPDYDAIKKMEKELLGEFPSFEINYNEMLIKDFENRKRDGNWPARQTMLELGYLSEELYNTPQRFDILRKYSMWRKAYYESRMNDPENRKRYDALRSRMMRGRQWR
ncbi:hypothetical protein HWB76_gp033 [Streptomyces phage Blueeyedbeauty]|uniref:Uncharacterized protein n=1 Tax=Streptomyces phage Blueeyedbeauty TaxID=2250336 RepID=A0A345L265_9CAUD|nr:hypothetical protein HWB76_gp033 [Streptomyces phage Blueeyedbeauty]AXH49367.1 hypothetical protein SEA_BLUEEYEDBEAUTY_260 [Streptomyces phage Blueeyedbeauty]